MPPGLVASSSAHQTFDYEFERQVMSNDASASFDAFLAKPRGKLPLKKLKSPAPPNFRERLIRPVFECSTSSADKRSLHF